MGPMAGLMICCFEKEGGFYLFGCDDAWRVKTDTWHETLDEAKNRQSLSIIGSAKRELMPPNYQRVEITGASFVSGRSEASPFPESLFKPTFSASRKSLILFFAKRADSGHLFKQTQGRLMKRFYVGMIVAGTAAMISGCSPHRPVDVAPQVATADNTNYPAPTEPPPPVQQDVIPACPGMPPQWWFIPGHWAWRGQWAWIPGHWRPRPHSGDVWLPGQWVKENDVYVWHGGSWRSGAPADEESNEVK